MTWLRVGYRIDGEHDVGKIERALHLTEGSLCSVSRTLRASAPVTHELTP